METKYCFEIGFQSDDLDHYIKLDSILPCSKQHHAHLFPDKDKIEIHVFYDPKTYFGDKLSTWASKINWRKFGEYIEVFNANQNDRITSISFKEAKLDGITTSSGYFNGNFSYVVIKLDWVRIDWIPNQDVKNTAEFYLNDAGFKAVSEFYAPMLGDDNKFKIGRRSEKYFNIEKSKYRPEFNFWTSDNVNNNEAKIVKEPKLQFLYTDINEKNTFEYADIICSGLSFFYQNFIDYSFARIHLEDKTITVTLPKSGQP